MKEHNGENPQNARIKINYTGKKPKVNFSYPIDKKNSGTRGNMFLEVQMLCLFIFFIYLCLTSPSILDQTYEQSELQKFAECAAQNSIETLNNYSYVRNDLCEPGDKIYLSLIRLMGLFFIFFLILPILIYFPFRKKWDSLFPDWKALTSFKKYRKFNKKDLLQDKEGKYYLELPVFNNVVCDFNATEDFSKYLDEFEIKEYNFYSYGLKKFKLKNKKKIKKRKINELIWYAKWYFKSKPTKGYMEVIFK